MGVLSLLGRYISGRLKPHWHVREGSTAGEFVNVDTAMQLSTAWACVRLLAENVGTLPLVLHQKDAAGDATPAERHPLYAILHDRPNADFSASEFWEGVVFHLATRGNAYAEVDRRGDDSVIALTLLDPSLMDVSRGPDGERRYRYSDRAGSRLIAPSAIFHVRGFGPGDDVGLSPIGYAARSMGLAMAAERSAARAFAQGGRPIGFLAFGKDEQAPTAPQWSQIKDLYFSEQARKEGPADVMPLPPGMSFTSTGLNPDDAQLLETRGFDVETICRWFMVQPVMIGHTSKSTSFGAGLEQQNLWFLQKTLRPYLRRIRDAISNQLLLPSERATYFAAFNPEGLLETDSKARSEFLRGYVKDGIFTVNEARKKENRPPLPGGDVLRAQAQYVPLAGEPEADSRIGHNGGPPIDEDEDSE